MSTAIKDVDGDGAADGVEDGVATKDAEGENAGAVPTPIPGAPLPNLPAMNGSSHHKDIYFQMDAMRTTGPTTYGHPVNAPFPGVPAGFVNIPAHSTCRPRRQ